MNLWFRFLGVLIGAWRGRRAELTSDSTLRFRTWLHDLDPNLHMNNGRYVTLMDLGRMDLLARTGLVREIFRRKWKPVVGGIHVSFRRSLKPFRAFELHTQVMAWDEKWLYFNQEFWCEGKLCTKAFVKATIRDDNGTVPISKLIDLLGGNRISPPIPEEWRAVIEADEKLNALLKKSTNQSRK